MAISQAPGETEMSVNYDNDNPSEGLVAAVNRSIGDCTQVAREYTELRYGEEMFEERREEVEEAIENYSNPYTEVLSRQDFFENVKPEIDELLGQ